MKKLQHVFPRISRLFTATHVRFVAKSVVSLYMWSALFFAVYINTVLGSNIIFNYSPITSLLLAKPFSEQSHFEAAQYYKTRGYASQSAKEVFLIKDISKNPTDQVLGASVEMQNTIASWESEPSILKEQFIYWKQITQQKPDYRDAYIQSAVFAWKLGNTTQARIFLEKAKELDSMVSTQLID